MTSVGSRKRTRDGDVKHNTELEDEAPSAKRAVSDNITRVLIPRDVVSTGPLACGHLIWPPGHPLLDSTGPDWPPTFKA